MFPESLAMGGRVAPTVTCWDRLMQRSALKFRFKCLEHPQLLTGDRNEESMGTLTRGSTAHSSLSWSTA